MTAGPLGQIGRYELLTRLAAGGMGEVFLARTVGTGGFEKRLVIKRILPHLADDPEFVRRFIAEGKLVVRLRHAGIAQVLDMGEEDGVTFIAMEYVDGRDLGELVKLARTGGVELPAPLIATIIVRLLEALDYAHGATDDDGVPLGIIHRDISPSNVMISRAGEVKLLDFGIARATERLQATTTGAIRGKYSYMSPQQAAGAALDARSDLFSVGVLMWELLTGVRPFDGDSDLLTLDRIRFHDPGPLREAAPDVPAPVAAVVERLLEKDPELRFPSAEAAMRALMAWLNEIGAVIVPRDVSAWLERVLATIPEGLRGRPSSGMSLDDLLVMGLGSEPARRGPTTDAAGASLARTVSAPGIGTPAAAPILSMAPQRTPTGRTPAPGGEAGTPYPTDPVVPAVGGRSSRGRRGVFALLVGLNVLLLGAVGWLVLRDGDDEQAAPIVESMTPDVVSGPPDVTVETTVAAATAAQSDAGALDASEDEDDTSAVALAAADSVQAVDAGPPATPGVAFGRLVSELGDTLAPEDVALTIRSNVDGAQVSVAGFRNGTAPHTIRDRPGTVLRGRVTAAGYHPRGFEATLGVDTVAMVTLKEIPRGKVTFRFWPANAKVYIGEREIKIVRNDTGVALNNLVTSELAVGNDYKLRIVPPSGPPLAVPFEITEGQTTRLGRVGVSGGP